MNSFQTYFDPETLSRIRPFSLQVHTLVEGLVVGKHRSALHGHSIEFAQHREYTPGDDLRQVDWKVFARSDRYYLKQYEDETTLNCYFLLDQSESMSYQGKASPLSKLEYARLIACSLLYLVIDQQDSAGLITFSAELDHFLSANASPTQFEDVIRILERPTQGEKTSIAAAIEATLNRVAHPGLLVLISDMLSDSEETLKALKLAKYAGHDLIVLNVFDPDEIQFPFDEMTCFDGLESETSLATDPVLIAGAYRNAMQQFIADLTNGCRQLGAEYFQLITNESLAQKLPSILATRAMKR